MPRNTEVSVGEFFSTKAQKSLKSYFGRVVKGQPEVYDTPFAEGETTEELLSAWMEVLQSINNTWPTLVEWEKDLMEKVGPLSVMQPLSERMDDITAYYEGIHLPSEPIHEEAVQAVLHEWGAARGMHMRAQRATIEFMKKSTNSGSPYFTKRRDVVSKTYPCNVRWTKDQVVQGLNLSDDNSLTYGSNWWDACAVLGWRGQEGGLSREDVKQRVVWMFPFAVNIRELQVYQPAIEVAQKMGIYPAWVSMDAVDRGVTQLFDTKGDKDLVVCTDFTKFDQHFNSDLQDAASNVIQNLFAPTKAFSLWVENVYPIKYMIPLMYNYGQLMIGQHGMGSGSGGTNFDETLAHRALQFEAAQTMGVKLNPNSQCLGDDGILSYPGITVEDVIKAYTRHGLEMNESKQYVSIQECTYLRRWHHRNYRERGVCVGVYSTMRALGRLRYLERFHDPEWWNEKAVALRQLSILENVKWHPLKEQFVDFCMKRDKYRLGIDIPGFLDNITLIAQENIDHMPDFLGYTKTMQLDAGNDIGIAGWWIVKYLKSKR